MPVNSTCKKRMVVVAFKFEQVRRHTQQNLVNKIYWTESQLYIAELFRAIQRVIARMERLVIRPILLVLVVAVAVATSRADESQPRKPSAAEQAALHELLTSIWESHGLGGNSVLTSTEVQAASPLPGGAQAFVLGSRGCGSTFRSAQSNAAPITGKDSATDGCTDIESPNFKRKWASMVHSLAVKT